MKFQNKFVNMLIMGFLLLLAIAACSPAGSDGEVEPDIESGAMLDSTNWVLNEFGSGDVLTAVLPDTTITLNFADGGINGSAGCNRYFGEATQANDSLTFGAIGSTKMACPEPIMQQENEYLAALAAVNSFTLEGDQLILHSDDGRLTFTAGTAEEASNEADAAGDEVVKTLFVGPERVDCVGVAPQKCLQVRESENEEWSLFYGQIVGFDYEPGYEYELRVSETEIDNPPADASALELTLLELVSKTAVSATPVSRPEGKYELQGTSWVLTTFGPNDNQTAVLSDTELTLNFDGAQINGFAGCNSYFADVTVEEDGKLSVGLVGSTLMACLDEDVMQQESDFLAALNHATSYTLSGHKLTLHSDNGSLEFVAATIHESGKGDAEVVDWETAVSILNSGEVVEIFQTHSLDVTLTLADGRTVQTVEPAIDDILHAIEECGEPCSNILQVTE